MDDATREQFHSATVATIVQVLEDLGFPGMYLTGVSSQAAPAKMIGTARTLRCLPFRRDVADRVEGERALRPHRVAFDGISAGEVLLIAARGVLEAAVLGDLFAGRVAARNGAGIVTDGAVRDVIHLPAHGLPIFSRGVQSATFSARHLGLELNVPISCAEVLIEPGDIVIGDEEGVVCVPSSIHQEVAQRAATQEHEDAAARRELLQGQSLEDSYPR